MSGTLVLPLAVKHQIPRHWRKQQSGGSSKPESINSSTGLISGTPTTAGTYNSTVATYSNLNKNTGYAQKSFSLSGFAGQTVTLKFTATEDSSPQTAFVVDDTAVNVS